MTTPVAGDPEPVLPPSRAGRTVVLVVLAVALVLRVTVALVIHDTYAPLNDAVEYDTIASSLASGDGYGTTFVPEATGPTAFRAPMYPVVLASLYVVVGEHHWTAGLLQNALIGVALVAVLGIVATQLFGRRVGGVAMAIAAVHPTLVLFGTSLQIEPLLVTLELATLAAILQHRRRPAGLRYVVLSAVLLGCTVLTREIGVWLVPVVVLLAWGGGPRWSRQALVPPLVAVGVAALVVLPWTVRNAVEMDAFVPVTTTAGVGVAGVYNQTSFTNTTDPALWIPPWFDPAMAEVMQALPDPDEVDLDRALRRAAVDFLADHPSYLPEVMFWNTVRLFDLAGPNDALFIRQYIPYPEGLTRVSVYASYVIYVLAALGALRAAARGAPKALWLFPVLVWLNLAVLSGNIRYRASIEPFLVLLAAVAVASWSARSRPVQSSAPEPSHDHDARAAQ